MLKQLKIIAILIAASILLCACPAPEGQEYIYIVNKSDKPIAFDISINDTTFQCSDIGHKVFFGVQSNSTYKLNDGNTYASWDTELQLLTIFIFYRELYMDYNQSCQTIREHVPILHTYRLTLSDLKRMNWTVVYPPEEQADLAKKHLEMHENNFSDCMGTYSLVCSLTESPRR